MRDNAWWAYGFIASITPCPWDLCQEPAFDSGLCCIYIRFRTGYHELHFFWTCIWFDQHGVFKNLEQTFQKVGRFFTTPDFQLKMLEELGLIFCMAHITWSWTVAAYLTNATLLSLSQSSLIFIASQQVAGMKGNRQLNDFTPEWETSCPSLRGLWAERAVQKPGSLYSRCYWPAWGPWTSYVTSLSLSFVMSPTCNKYLWPLERCLICWGKII